MSNYKKAAKDTFGLFVPVLIGSILGQILVRLISGGW